MPEPQLLVTRTDRIDGSLPALAEFLSISTETLDLSRTHLYKAAGRYDVLTQIDPGLLREKCLSRCGPLVERYFPELIDLQDPAASLPSRAGNR